ncbi:hypothetical protein N5J06_20020 [Ralstonia sp. CHL-2022]|uniref:OmpA-like domain-containing protein n=1 Tax=Ralstonia mojiangensis TaxID=2953895 RepID=A0ABT2LDH3_9RALS|nr:hypothetical protein [Ralstonia mojiangensis]MCT7313267.1 hypothetical protein [Ralstonia mojiangensis]
MADPVNMDMATRSLNLAVNNKRERASWRRRAAVLSVAVALTSLSAGAYEKPTYAITVRFAPASTAVTPEMRIKLAELLDHIKRGHWCPLEAIWANGSADLSESGDHEARAKLAKARADAVANELRALGAPTAITFSGADGLVFGTQAWQGVVQIETVGGSYQQPCPKSQDAKGFRVPGR